VTAGIGALMRAARPVDPEFAGALARRWAELPQTAWTPAHLHPLRGGPPQPVHGVLRHQPSFLDHGDSVGDALHLVQLV
jgi:hypothetical protein